MRNRFLWFRIFIFSLIIEFDFARYAQAQIQIGAKAGFINSTASVDTRNIAFTETESLNGLQLGLVYDHDISSTFSIRTELLYAEKGYRVRKYFDASYFDTKKLQNSSYWQLQMNYLEVPILFKWNVESARLKFYLNAGFYGAYWFSGKNTGSFFTANLGDPFYARKTASEKYDFDNDFGANKRKDNRFDIGAVVGTGLAYKIKQGEFFLEGRYNYGFADRYTFESAAPKYYQTQTNKNWSVTFGFMFNLKPKKLKKIKNQNVEEDDEPQEEESN